MMGLGGLERRYIRAKDKLTGLWNYAVVDPVEQTIDLVAEVDIPSTADIQDVAEDVFDKAVNGLITVAEIMADVFGQIASGIYNASIDIVKNVGPAVVDGVENTYDYVRGKLRGKEPDIIAAVTVGLLTILTGVYLYNAARRGTPTFSE